MDDVLLCQGPKKNAALASYKKNHSGPIGSGLLEMVGFPRIDKYLEKGSEYRKARQMLLMVEKIYSAKMDSHILSLTLLQCVGKWWSYP